MQFGMMMTFLRRYTGTYFMTYCQNVATEVRILPFYIGMVRLSVIGSGHPLMV